MCELGLTLLPEPTPGTPSWLSSLRSGDPVVLRHADGRREVVDIGEVRASWACVGTNWFSRASGDDFLGNAIEPLTPGDRYHLSSQIRSTDLSTDDRALVQAAKALLGDLTLPGVTK